MNCAHRHNLSYIQGYRPKTDSTPLVFGSLFHEAMNGIIKDGYGDWYVQAALDKMLEDGVSDIMASVITNTAEQALKVAERTDDWMGISAGKWKTVYHEGEPLVELKMSIPIPGWEGYVGIADWVAEDQHTGKVYAIDWKTRGRIADPRSEDVNLQLMTYLHMLWSLGIKVDSGAIVQVLSKLPVQPKLNKNGQMSRSKVATDWSTYEEALIANDLDPDDYYEMRDKLDAQFFDFVGLDFSLVEVSNAWNEIVLPAASSIINDENRIRNMSPWNCRNCGFKQPCLEGLRGHDAQGTLDMFFERRDE